MTDPPTSREFVGRGGIKLAHALDVFRVDPTGLVCADLGCNVGGFTDCLLQRGAKSVYAIDTGYGMLDYRLRIDPRVTVMERTNALHAEPCDHVDLCVIDLAWTPQSRALPAAMRWLGPGGRIITLIKPHYEASHGPEADRLKRGVLSAQDAQIVLDRVLGELPGMGVHVDSVTKSPIAGGGKKRNPAGNVEFLALVTPNES